jgi:hypothetical protein
MLSNSVLWNSEPSIEPDLKSYCGSVKRRCDSKQVEMQIT